MKKILLTGCAGFIGAATTEKLIENGYHVIGIDNLNPYYDVTLKENRLKKLKEKQKFQFYLADISDEKKIKEIFNQEKPNSVLHLAAQAGVRYSIDHPESYIKSNLNGFYVMIETAKQMGVSHFVYASTSSVYGANKKTPFSVSDSTENPLSLYAATKKSNELMAHSYSSIFKMHTTGLRFFTVYGPWGRPDMALFKFTKNILEGRPIDVYNNGNHTRDFTYISDIVEGLLRVIEKGADVSKVYRVYNLGSERPVPLMRYIELIEKFLGKTAEKNYMPLQLGDVESTFADMSEFERDFNFKPKVSTEAGVENFIKWYKEYFKV